MVSAMYYEYSEYWFVSNWMDWGVSDKVTIESGRLPLMGWSSRTLGLAMSLVLCLVGCVRQDVGEPGESVTLVADVQPVQPVIAPINWQFGHFEPGTAFFDQMMDAKVSPNTIQEIVQTLSPVYDFRKSRTDHRWGLGWQDGELAAFSLDVSPVLQFEIDFGENGAELSRRDIPLKVIPEVVVGSIQTSLFGALQNEPHGALLAMKLARVFAWDIDFYQDPRRGDVLEILVERQYIESDEGLVFFEYGEILAARYLAERDQYDAFLFKDEDGDPAYFNAKGQSLIRDVLRSPLKFQRITSKFTQRRFHPILKKNKAHRGVDYGAPTNTPVMVVAKGKVIKAGRSGGAGIAVEVRHRGEMVTQYFHLNKIAKGVRVGTKVKQGQVIGYVGQTGWATAPHLHFGMKIRNQYVDPLRQKFEPGLPVPAHRMDAFKAVVASLEQVFERAPTAVDQVATKRVNASP